MSSGKGGSWTSEMEAGPGVGGRVPCVCACVCVRMCVCMGPLEVRWWMDGWMDGWMQSAKRSDNRMAGRRSCRGMYDGDVTSSFSEDKEGRKGKNKEKQST